MRLAWKNLNYDRLRFAATLIGISFSVFLMMFQGSLLAGFVRASSKIIDSTDSDLWITARGIPCLDFSAPIPDRFRELASGFPAIRSVQRIAQGAGVWQQPSGLNQVVEIIGADIGVGGTFPLPYVDERQSSAFPESVIIDQSNAHVLGVFSTPVKIEINQHRAEVVRTIDDFSSFLGQPYVFTTYNAATTYLGFKPEETRFLIIKAHPGADIKTLQQQLRARFSEVDVWTKDEFSFESRKYWVIQTGAGGALLTAAVLGFVVGAVIVSQTTYATTMENLEEFATLKAIGASRGYVQRLVLTQSIISGLIGCFFGLLVAYPMINVARGQIPWIWTPWWMPFLMVGASLLMCALASLVSIRKAVSVDPGRVFRA
jgi:putative ABC transport system permease protein